MLLLLLSSRLVVQGFLRDRQYVGALRTLEHESGVELPVDGEDMQFLRGLILDGKWAEVLEWLQPFSRVPSARADAAIAQSAVLKQRILELYDGRMRPEAEVASVDELLPPLRELKATCTPSEFDSFSFVLTLETVTDHPEFRHWSPYQGRGATVLAVQSALARHLPKPAQPRPAHERMRDVAEHALEEELARARFNGQKEEPSAPPPHPPNSVSRQDPGLSPARWGADDSSGSEAEWEDLVSTLEQRASANAAKTSPVAAPVSWEIPPPRRNVRPSTKDAESDHEGEEDEPDFSERQVHREELVDRPAAPQQDEVAARSQHSGEQEASALPPSGWGGVERRYAADDALPRSVSDTGSHSEEDDGMSLPWVSALQRGHSLHCHPIGVWRESQPIRTIAFEPLGGALAIGSNARSVRLVDTEVEPVTDDIELPTLPLLHEWRNRHHGSVYCLAWSSAWGGPQRTAQSRVDEEHAWAHEASPWLASGSNDTCIQLVQSTPLGSTPSPAAAAAAPGATRSLRTPSSAGGGTVRTVQFLAPHLLVSGGSGDFALRVWDVNATPDAEGARSPVAVWAGHSGVVFAACALAPRGTPPGAASQRSTVVSAGADGTLRLWDARVAGGEVMRLSGGATRVAEAPLQRSGHVEIQSLAAWDATSTAGAGQRPMVAGGLGDGSVRVWDLTAGTSQPMESVFVHGSDVRGLSLAPTGDPVLATASFDGTASILVEREGRWEVVHRWGKEQQDAFGHSDRLLSVQWHPHQPMLATSSADKSVCLWELEGW